MYMYVYVRKYTVHHNMIYTMYIIYQNRIFYTLVASQNVASTLAPNHQRNASRLACCACTVFLPAFLASSNCFSLVLQSPTSETSTTSILQQPNNFNCATSKTSTAAASSTYFNNFTQVEAWRILPTTQTARRNIHNWNNPVDTTKSREKRQQASKTIGEQDQQPPQQEWWFPGCQQSWEFVENDNDTNHQPVRNLGGPSPRCSGWGVAGQIPQHWRLGSVVIQYVSLKTKGFVDLYVYNQLLLRVLPKCHSEILCYHRYITVYIYITLYITKTPQPKSHTRTPWTASNSPAEELESQEGETAVACGSCECRSRSSLIWLKTRNLQRHRFCAGHVRSGENLNVRHVWSVVTEMRCFKCGRTSSHLAFDG